MSAKTEDSVVPIHRVRSKKQELAKAEQHHNSTSKAKGSNRLRRVLWYAQHRFRVFPCKPGSKRPLTKHGFKNATADPTKITKWWTDCPDANIGLRTGKASGLLALDVDPRNGGNESLSALEETYGPLPETAKQITGGGGRHVIFRNAPGVRCGLLAPGLDIKAEGGYIVVAPSVHPSGKRYKWDGNLGRKALLTPAPVPVQLLKLIKSSRNGARPAAVTDQEKLMRGERNSRLTSIAGSMRAQGCSRDSIEAALLEENRLRCDPPLLESEVRSIAKSVAHYPPNRKPHKRMDVPETGQFQVTDEGVFRLTEGDETVKLAARVDVLAQTRDAASENWGRLLSWKDNEDHVHQWAMPMELLASDAGAVRARLLAEGLPFITTNARLRERFTEYLQTATIDRRVRCVGRIGWHVGTYVLPDAAIGPEGGEEILHQIPHEVVYHWNVRGTMDEWREHVGQRCRGNSRLILAVSCGFAGPLLSLVGAESGGVHFHGATSTGKSTALIVGGSVCGGGGQTGFVQTWRTTINGLEAVAEAHNDAALFLDELSQVDAREAAETAYLLGNENGKQRMTRSTGARRKLTWKLIYISAGEMTLAEHAASVGKRTRGGAEVRSLNIEADAGKGFGLFENLHGAVSPDAFANEMKRAALRCYGAPLRKFVGRLVREPDSAKSFFVKVQNLFMEKCVSADAPGEVRRAAARFALIAAAGEMATRWGLTGWEKNEAASVVKLLFEEWLQSRGTHGPSDAEAGVRQVRSFIQTQGSRFQNIRAGHADKSVPIRDRVGFVRFNEETLKTQEYFLFPEVFKKEVCAGCSARAVLKELETRGYLKRRPPDLTEKPYVAMLGRRVRMYCIRAAILEGDE